MNLLFLIGNGFDLSFGMHSRYNDMYDSYVKSESPNMNIARFKESIEENYETWGDFEVAMAKDTPEFISEDDFVECLRNFKEFLLGYMNREYIRVVEQYKLHTYTPMIDEMISSVNGVYGGLIKNVQNDIQLEVGMNDKQRIKIRTINFNYTDLFDVFLEIALKDKRMQSRYDSFQKQDIIHIHGTLQDGGAYLTLGVDDISQLGKSRWQASEKTRTAFIKPEFNKITDRDKADDAKKYINESNIICIYGHSMGPSDNTWVSEIREWLKKDKSHHLIWYIYEYSKNEACFADKKIELEHIAKPQCLSKLKMDKVDSRILDQIHIPIGYDIFNFEAVIKIILEDAKRKQFSNHIIMPIPER